MDTHYLIPILCLFIYGKDKQHNFIENLLTEWGDDENNGTFPIRTTKINSTTNETRLFINTNYNVANIHKLIQLDKQNNSDKFVIIVFTQNV